MLIVDNFELPKPQSTSRFAQIQVGQAAFIPDVDAKKVKGLQGSLNNYKKKHPEVKFETRTIKEPVPGAPDGITYPVFVIKRAE